MDFSEQTMNLLHSLNQLAGRKLVHQDELAFLLELAFQSGSTRKLMDLSFTSKSAHNLFGIMKRIGRDADGYENLSKEFSEAIEKSRLLMESLLVHADERMKQEFHSRFLTTTPQAFESFLSLLHDLSWLKNYEIDFGRNK